MRKLLIILVFFSSVAHAEVPKASMDECKNPNPITKKDGKAYNEQELFTGRHIYCIGGVYILENYKDGILNGDYVMYKEDSSPVEHIATYVNGKKDGVQTSYDKYGIHTTSEYKNGLLNGKVTYYNENGVRIQVNEYIDDVIIEKTYYTAKGMLHKIIEYHENGIKSFEGNYFEHSSEAFFFNKTGVLYKSTTDYSTVQTETYYHKDGSKIYELRFESYDLEPTNISVYLGNKKVEYDYLKKDDDIKTDGMKTTKSMEAYTGHIFQYTEDGKLSQINTYERGYLSKRDFFYEDGRIWGTATFINDFTEEKMYDRQGNLAKHGTFSPYGQNIKYYSADGTIEMEVSLHGKDVSLSEVIVYDNGTKIKYVGKDAYEYIEENNIEF